MREFIRDRVVIAPLMREIEELRDCAAFIAPNNTVHKRRMFGIRRAHHPVTILSRRYTVGTKNCIDLRRLIRIRILRGRGDCRVRAEPAHVAVIRVH